MLRFLFMLNFVDLIKDVIVSTLSATMSAKKSATINKK